MTAQFPSLDRAPRIERRAHRIADPVARLRYLRRQMSPGTHSPWVWLQEHRVRVLCLAVLALVLGMAPGSISTGTAETLGREHRLLSPASASSPMVSPAIRRVWRVEQTDSTELYSNGLRIDLTFAVSNRPRSRFPIYSLTGTSVATKTGTAPVGIVYHTTESNLAPFDEEANRRLKQLGQNLLEVIRREHSYHYVIDRFGRVFRVVQERDAANHAGYSVWADTEGIYVNLNDSFLGVAFEAQTGATDEVTPAQISAGKVLTEMLRGRYGIAGENCVTHAQVSVNPLNMRIGAHTDWADKFPFAGLGLPNNYMIPLPSLYAFGFRYDEVFLQATGNRWKGLDVAVDQVERQAAAEGLSAIRYRAILRHRYKVIEEALQEHSAQNAVVHDAKNANEGGS